MAQRLSFSQLLPWRSSVCGSIPCIPIIVDLVGKISPDILEAAFIDLIGRHDSLRSIVTTRFGNTSAFVSDNLVPVSLSVASGIGGLGSFVSELIGPGTPPVRVRLFRLREASRLVCVVQSLAMDMWSIRPFLHDLHAAYSGRATGRDAVWSSTPSRYSDFSAWQCSALGTENDPRSMASSQWSFWSKTFWSFLPPRALPFAASSEIKAGAGQHDRISFRLNSRLHHNLLDFARVTRTSVFMVLHAGLLVLLYKLGAGPNIPVCTTISGRRRNPDFYTIGCCANVVTLCVKVSDRLTFYELLARVKLASVSAAVHGDFPLQLF